MNNLEGIPIMLDIINVLECFAPVFSAGVWRHAKTLLIGAILCRKERTVAAILLAMGWINVFDRIQNVYPSLRVSIF